MPSVTVAVPPEFSFDECLRYLNRSSQETLPAAVSRAAKKAIQLDDALVFIRVSPLSSGLSVEYHSDQVVPDLDNKVRTYVTEWFDLKTDLRPFYKLAQSDTVLGPVAAQHFGLRLIGIADLFEAMSWAIIGQQINLTFAYLLKQRLVAQFGKTGAYQGHTYALFPSPETMAACVPAQLTTLQFSARKAEYIVGIAQAIADCRLTKEHLLRLPQEEAYETLIQYRGVGSWTANYVLLKCLRYPDAFPAKDVGLHNAIKRQLNLSQKPTLSEVYNYAQPWYGWRGYATFYLWQSLVAN